MKNLMKRLENIKGGHIVLNQCGTIEDELSIEKFNYCERKDSEGNKFLVLQDDSDGYERKLNEFFIESADSSRIEPIIHMGDISIQIQYIH